MLARTLSTLFLLLSGAAIGAAVPVPVPDPLKGWEAWVLHGEEWRQCPFYAAQGAGSEENHACALPGPATIRIADGAATITLDYRVYAAGQVPLVHAQDAAPEALEVDGRVTVVAGEPPQVWLEPGQHALRYRLDLGAQPESLRVPESLRLLRLEVAGKPIFPLNREGEELWLERAEAAPTQADALEVGVHRLWSDGIPQSLSTLIELHVAGKAREIRLGPAWPPDYELTRIDGDLPATVEPGRVLRVQATAGSFELRLHARALTPSTRLSFEFPGGDWPSQEIWSFAAEHALRVVDVAGDVPIDPAQADVPAGWREYPAFAIASGDALTLSERSRGLGDNANRVSLRRELWLDFDGGGYTVQDHLDGRMRQGFRLDLAAPFDLKSASEGGEPLLVTAGARAGLRGVELRIPRLNVDATSRLAWTTILPAHGWSERLDGLETALHLPPGWRLLHADGADRAPQSWTRRWDIYAVFIAAFAVVLAWRLGGAALAAAVGLLMVLGVHEPGAPRYSLIALLLFALAWGALRAGRLRRTLGAATLGAALICTWVALPFAITQARLALHPQLADGAAARNWTDAGGGFANVAPMDMAMQEQGAMVPSEPVPMAPPPPPMPADKADNQPPIQRQSIEAVQVSGSRSKRQENFERYAKDAVVQAGVGRPNWRWMRVDLGFDGPVDSAQSLDLWLSPPWLTAVWRLLLVASLVLIAGLLLRRARRPARASPRLAALLVGLLLAASASAADTPDPALLAQLRERLTQAPPCAAVCARYAAASLSVQGEILRLEIDVHAAERVLLPLPLDDAALAAVEVSLDGATAPVLGHAGQAFVASERGVHRLALSGRVRGDRVALDFALKPTRLEIAASGWGVVGLRDGRLLAERLELLREAPVALADAQAAPAAPARVPVKPFVRVIREIDLDLDWTVRTTVERIAPADGGYSVRVPLLAGEQPQDPTLRVDAGVAEVTLQPGSHASTIDSRLTRADALELVAPELAERAEVWRVRVGPSLSLRSSGVPAREPDGGIDEGAPWVHEFQPLPGEVLSLSVQRPTAVPGATVVADRVGLASVIGARSRTETLTLALRATQGGSQPLKLPVGAELLSLAIDGRTLNLKAENGVLALPVKPGEQTVSLSWRRDEGVDWRVATPEVDLGLDAANITLQLALPADRWLLRLSGPPVGPAVLYWSSLLVLLALGWGLGRSGRALLPVRDWLLLVLGFSTLSYAPLLLVALAFIALDARRRYLPGDWGSWRFDLAQLALAALVLAAFVALVLAIPSGLLGSPQMHVAGSAQYGQLAWLADRAGGVLPQARAISLPMWVHKALMLAFALWLAWSFVGWLRMAWSALTHGVGWMRLRRRIGPAPEPAA
ncbi:MAG: hypothetical protein IT479_00250 [Xanthomonadales bacterium]|nr:hypothetical protein [Xanthomonadales bacterium]MCC6591684.1 hypothetical protein [Xanthomonadales bacterium]MCE7931283.1 hypothetical protein [Xanthomonadales bacterium PRO6]